MLTRYLSWVFKLHKCK